MQSGPQPEARRWQCYRAPQAKLQPSAKARIATVHHLVFPLADPATVGRLAILTGKVKARPHTPNIEGHLQLPAAQVEDRCQQKAKGPVIGPEAEGTAAPVSLAVGRFDGKDGGIDGPRPTVGLEAQQQPIAPEFEPQGNADGTAQVIAVKDGPEIGAEKPADLAGLGALRAQSEGAGDAEEEGQE